ncbi:hypothetical protein [Flavihumibacter sp. UBA7668]|uniref:hypothetical protein n=1 Tax=Flavihumibacter sp. UBA7668 TaxID=1946542 RepID=UPI0025C4FC28|nr:hypothetical protein [Flavihumibacter sp. UBA7668]
MRIEEYKWTVSPTGSGMTAGSFFMKPIDFFKVISLVKQKGNWNGKQLVSEAWIEKSTNCTINIDFSFTRY